MTSSFVSTSKPDRLSTLDRRRINALHAILFLIASLVWPGSARAQGTNLPLLATFTNPSPTPLENFFGLSTAVGADLVLFGAQNEHAAGFRYSGAAYLFDMSGVLLTTFTSPAPADSQNFGSSVALLGGDRVLIGAQSARPSANVGPWGAAHLFTTNGTLLTTITNPTPSDNGGFGFTVAAVGTDRLLVGAPYNDTATSAATGAAYLFSTNGTLLASFLNPDGEVQAFMGQALAVVGDSRILLGAPGAVGGGKAYLFNTNGTWLTTFTNPTPGSFDRFGQKVAALGTNLVATSAPGDTTGAFGAGAAYLFRIDGTLLTTITNPVPAASTYFGEYLAAVGNDRVLLSRYGVFSTPGTAYLFTTNGTLLTTITNFGFAWALAGAGSDRVLVSASRSSNPENVSLFALPYPQLDLTRNGAAVSLKWVSAETGLVLQQAGALGTPTAWSNSTDTVSVTGQTNIVQQPLGSTNRFFRLRRP